MTELKNQLNEVKMHLEDKMMADGASYQAGEVLKIIDLFLLDDDEGDALIKERLTKLSKCFDSLSIQTQEKLDLLDFVPLISKF